MQASGIQMMRNGEYNVVVFYGQGTSAQVVDPECLLCSLAFGTVPVATAIVTVSHRTTAVAFLLMPSKCGGAADCYLTQHL